MKDNKHDYNSGQLFNDRGQEVPDATPVEMPLRLRQMKPADQRAEIKRMIVEEMSNFASDHGRESFVESDDFNIPDDEPDIVSPYEMSLMQEEYVDEASTEAPADTGKSASAATDPASIAEKPSTDSVSDSDVSE